MLKPSSIILSQGHLSSTLLIALLAIPYFINLGASSLWDANEAFYAETPREMLETGNYLAPQFNYRTRAQKPPLTYWIVLAAYKIFGVSESAARVPGALAALGTLLFTWLIGRALFSPATGLVAAIVLATTPRFFVLARRLPIDILLLFWLTGASYFLIRCLQRSSPDWKSWAPLYLFLGLGFLTKGPIAWVIPAAAYLVWAISTKRLSTFPALRVGAGLVILVMIVLPWYLLVYTEHGWDYVLPFFLKDNLGRFAGESMGPDRGPHYYVLAYLADFFPWSVVSLAALSVLWKQRTKMDGETLLASRFPLCWSGIVFLFFSLARNKQEYYIAPIYPLIAVVLAGVLVPIFRPKDKSQISSVNSPWMWSFIGVFLGFSGVAAASSLILRPMMPELHPALHLLPVCVLGLAALILVWQIIRSDPALCFATVAASLWMLLVFSSGIYLPAVEAFRPVKEMCLEIDKQSRPEDDVGYYVATLPSMVYYLRRPIFEEFDPEAMMKRFQSNKTVFCILSQRDYNYFVGGRDLILYVLDRRPRLVTQLRLLLDEDSWAAHDLLLVSNRPAVETGSREGRSTP